LDWRGLYLPSGRPNGAWLVLDKYSQKISNRAEFGTYKLTPPLKTYNLLDREDCYEDMRTMLRRAVGSSLWYSELEKRIKGIERIEGLRKRFWTRIWTEYVARLAAHRRDRRAKYELVPEPALCFDPKSFEVRLASKRIILTSKKLRQHYRKLRQFDRSGFEDMAYTAQDRPTFPDATWWLQLW
jgi:hypothetical protein